MNYTEEEALALARRLHTIHCEPHCQGGITENWIEWAREILDEQPQRETLFND